VLLQPFSVRGEGPHMPGGPQEDDSGAAARLGPGVWPRRCHGGVDSVWWAPGSGAMSASEMRPCRPVPRRARVGRLRQQNRLVGLGGRRSSCRPGSAVHLAGVRVPAGDPGDSLARAALSASLPARLPRKSSGPPSDGRSAPSGVPGGRTDQRCAARGRLSRGLVQPPPAPGWPRAPQPRVEHDDSTKPRPRPPCPPTGCNRHATRESATRRTVQVLPGPPPSVSHRAQRLAGRAAGEDRAGFRRPGRRGVS
jgi:hypothetical protein